MKVILIASGKGGTGKTSFSAGVSVALAMDGKRVLVIDGDIGLRNLDIVLGMSDRLVFSFADVALSVVTLEKAIARHPVFPNLHVLTSPFGRARLDVLQHGISGLIDAAKAADYDYVLVDAPAGIGDEITMFARVATQAIIITTPDTACVRGAEVMARQLEAFHLFRLRLVVNRVRPRLIKYGMANNIDDTMDITGLPLLGLVPEDEDVIICGNTGTSILLSKQKGAAKAYQNIARRLEGHKLPLMRI